MFASIQETLAYGIIPAAAAVVAATVLNFRTNIHNL
jgi:hypothetical protein